MNCGSGGINQWIFGGFVIITNDTIFEVRLDCECWELIKYRDSQYKDKDTQMVCCWYSLLIFFLFHPQKYNWKYCWEELRWWMERNIFSLRHLHCCKLVRYEVPRCDNKNILCSDNKLTLIILVMPSLWHSSVMLELMTRNVLYHDQGSCSTTDHCLMLWYWSSSEVSIIVTGHPGLISRRGWWQIFKYNPITGSSLCMMKHASASDPLQRLHCVRLFRYWIAGKLI